MELFGLVVRAFFEVLVVAGLLGAGLPALFATGIRLLAWSEGASDVTGAPVVVRPWARVCAYGVFALTVCVVLLGVAVIVASGLGSTLPF